jgi:hypothetical protein
MNQKTHLVNWPTTDPYKLAEGYRFVTVYKNGQTWYCSYYTEAKNKNKAVERAIQMLWLSLEDKA